jgi:CPA2 family monovalent cation:H+ antiporter-2
MDALRIIASPGRLIDSSHSNSNLIAVTERHVPGVGGSEELIPHSGGVDMLAGEHAVAGGDLGVLGDLLLSFSVAAIAVSLFHRLRLPSIVGLLVAGMLVGPYGLGLINDVHRVSTLSEIGVVVLLFAVGMEFSLSRLMGLGRLMIRLGFPQVIICLVAGVVGSWWYLGDVRPAILVGMLLAMSSTAVVFKLLTDRGELQSPQGIAATAVLLLQDMLVVVCMLLLPLLAEHDVPVTSVVTSLVLGSAIVALLFLGRYVVPSILYQVARTNNRELFLIVIVLLCLGSAALTASMGWSLALGAFLAGLMLAESEYAAQTIAEVLPFRDTLASLFFISVGMLLDLRMVGNQLGLIVATVMAVVMLKFLAAAVPTLWAGYPARLAVLVGVTLAQVGEFSFILAERGRYLDLLSPYEYQIFLSSAVLTVMLTPILISSGPWLAERVAHYPFFSGRDFEHSDDMQAGPSRHGHVLIAGYGVNGRNLARVLQVVDIDYVVLELNPETVRQGRKANQPIVYGDCSRLSVLRHCGIDTARVFVIAISDPINSRRALEVARRANPRLHIVVRTRYLAEVEQLRRLGADVIIPEEFETSVEIFAQVLREYDLPQNLILDLIDRVRRDHYEVLRDTKVSPAKVELPFDILDQLEIETCLIGEMSPSKGKTLAELQLRTATGATLMAIRRRGKLIINPAANLRFEEGDIAVCIGDRMQVDAAVYLLAPPHRPTTLSSTT